MELSEEIPLPQAQVEDEGACGGRLGRLDEGLRLPITLYYTERLCVSGNCPGDAAIPQGMVKKPFVSAAEKKLAAFAERMP